MDVPAESALYMPLDQTDDTFHVAAALIVRTDGDPLALAPAVRRAIWDVDPNQPVSSLRAMSEVLDRELNNRDLQLTLIGSFAVLALVLAAVGLYGVLSYTVSQNTSEIGLRMALGAEQRTVIGSVVRTALGTASLGIVIGLIAALILTRAHCVVALRSQPDRSDHGRRVAGVLLVVTAVAAFVPARRAASVDP